MLDIKKHMKYEIDKSVIKQYAFQLISGIC